MSRDTIILVITGFVSWLRVTSEVVLASVNIYENVIR
jgi:hypothetical protein